MLAAAYPTSSLPTPFQESRTFNQLPRPSHRPSSTRKSTSPPSKHQSSFNRNSSPRPRLASFYSEPPPQLIKLASFNDDNGFGDLLNSSKSAFADDSSYGAFPAAQDDDLSTNPFADMASSTIAYPSATQQQSYYDEPTSPISQPLPTPATPAQEETEDVSFHRESAPEPETPAPPPSSSAFTYSSYDNDPYTPSSPLASIAPALPLSPSEQTPFGSPPTSPPLSAFQSSPLASSTTGFQTEPASPSRPTNKPDLSALLGEEKPSLPSFSKPKRKERPEGVAGPLGSKIAVLPVSSVGRKPVGGALAALLGLEVEEEEKKSDLAEKKKGEKESTRKVEGDKEEVSSVEPEKPQEPAEPVRKRNLEDSKSVEIGTSEVPPPPPAANEPSIATDLVEKSAADVPLPPSPPADDLEAVAESNLTNSQTPVLSRMPSEAPSTVSTTTDNISYETMVSPLDTSVDETGERREAAWPANKQVEALESKLASVQISEEKDDTSTSSPTSTPTASFSAPSTLRPESETTPVPSTSAGEPSYSQYIFSDDTSNPQSAASSTPSRGFRAFNGSGDEGGFGGTDDGDSLRGAYSRSVEVGDQEDNETETGPSSPATERAIEREGSVRSQREGSAPLPPLPAPTMIQGSPRSKNLGGSLGPSFIITVGDPQTVGKNPASQHTVFTVRTRTTSSAFRKSDFSVLRRYSHFVWLYDALMQNNPGVIVPGMPEKHVIGRFGSDFIENRRLGLQAALTKIVAHPMLVGDPDLRLFLESDTFHIDIKQRKIDSSHESKGFLANLSSSISGPKFVEFDEYFENRRHALDTFETQLRALLTSLSAASKARQVLQTSMSELQASFLALAESDLSTQLRKLFNEAASLQKKLHDLSEAQAVSDEQIGGLVSVAESYARMCASARGVFGARIKAYHTWQSAESRLRKAQAEHEKGKRSGRTHSELLPDSVAMLADAERKMLDARHDFEDVSKLTKAEMARFDKEKVDDFKKALEEYTDSLAFRQREVVAGWQHYYEILVKAVEANESASAVPP
ncbi:hypothetical protein JCM5350_007035 [Sporobolomyces pararoseus]